MKKNLTINWVDVIDSTNLEALRQFENVSSGTVWVADFQTHGRGQRGNIWLSTQAKNLTYTILVKPNFLKISQLYYISMVSALSVYNYLKLKGIDAKIKWPNDIYSDNKKICGMLIENVLDSDSLAVCAIGIGVNINQQEFDSSLKNPTSVILELGDNCRELDRRKELDILLSEFFNLYEILSKKDGRNYIKSLFINSLYRLDEWCCYEEITDTTNLNRPVELIKGSSVFKGRIVGIDDEYNLLLEREDGSVKGYAFKEIKYIL